MKNDDYDPHTQLVRYHEEEKAMEEDIRKREEKTGRELEVVDSKNRDVKLPLRVAFEAKDQSFSKTPLWFLNALGNMTVEEYNQFMKEYRSELCLNEIAASDLLNDVITRKSEAVKTFWHLQERLLAKPSIQNTINIQAKPDSVMVGLLDDIEKHLLDHPNY